MLNNIEKLWIKGYLNSFFSNKKWFALYCPFGA
jgi:hypothetical protein